MKKLFKQSLSMVLTAILVFTAAFTLMPQEALAYTTSDGLVLNDSQTVVTGYTGNGGYVNIPSTVTSIDAGVFTNKTGITGINIPNSVTSIPDGLFTGCSGLTTISFGSGIATIPRNTFQNCTKLTTVTLPSSLYVISDNAFYGCTSLSTITLPATVSSISSSAFTGCTSLNSINITTNSYYASYDGCIYDSKLTKLIMVPGGKTSITFPSSVTTIGTNAFSLNTKITSVGIPTSVTTIEGNAFTDSYVRSITIPRNVVSISNQDRVPFTTIYGYTGSYAETFAKSRSINFISMDNGNYTITSITLDKTTLSLDLGTSSALIATILPLTAMNKDISWTSSNPSVASISASGISAIITANSIGTTVITATSTMDSTKTASCTVTVNAIGSSVKSVSLDQQTLTMRVGENAQKLTATVSPSTAINKDVTWTSSDTAVATVDQSGYVTPVAEGTATITVTTKDGNYKAEAKVTVQNIPATGISLSASYICVNEGGSVMLSATLTPAGAYSDISWWADDPLVVKTKASGDTVTITGYSAGETTIYASAGTYQAKCDIRVVSKDQPLIDKIQAKKATVSVSSGSKAGSITLKASKVTISGATVKYQFRYREKGGEWTKKKSKKNKITVSGLTAGKTYQVQVRIYSVIEDETFYGKWSSTASRKA